MGVLTAFNSSYASSKARVGKIYVPKREMSAYVALAIVDKGALPAVGGTTGTGGSAMSNTPAGIVAAIRRLELLGQAEVFPKGTINGKKDMPTENPVSFMAGNQDEPDVASITNSFEFMYRDAYTQENVTLFNKWRGNHQDKDIYVFTETSYKPIIVPNFNVNGAGYTIEGDKKKDISGAFKIKYTVSPTVGEPFPYFGVDTEPLKDYAKLTFAAPTLSGTVTANGTSCDDYLRYNVTNAGGTITFAIAETTTCLDWGVFKNGDGTVGADPVTVPNGVFTIGAGLAAGTYNYTIVAKNTLGHEALQIVQITKAA